MTAHDRRYYVMFMCSCASLLRIYFTASYPATFISVAFCTTYCRLPTINAHRQQRAVHRRAYCPTATSSITRYDKDTYFIHLMQSLEPTRFPDVTYPLDPILIEPTGGHWPLAYDFRYLKNILPT